jgi:mRNA-degrading endonuclease toxin of MazEF toxin-antitoxin module
MTDRGTVVWAPDPFDPDSENPRPWVVVSGRNLPYPDEGSIAVALTTQGHHGESIRVPSDAWLRGEPHERSFALPWSVATLKDDIDIVGVQGDVTADFADRIADATASYLTG